MNSNQEVNVKDQLPHAREIEIDVISSVAANPDWWVHISHLSGEHFTDPEAKEAFRSMSQLKGEGREWVSKHDADVPRWLTMGQFIASTFVLEEMVKRLEDTYVLRTGYIKAHEIAVASMQGEVEQVERLTADLVLPTRRGLGYTVEEVAGGMIDEWGSLRGQVVSTGYPLIDSKQILKRREGFGLAARPSMGKSQLAFQIAHNIVKAGGTVLIWSGEMDRRNMVHRLAGSMVGYSRWEVEGSMDRENSYQRALAEIASLKGMVIEDSPTLTSMDVWSLARKVKQEYNALDLVIVDHIRLLRDKNETERHRLGDITRNLREIAKDLNCTSMMLIQLNRASENRKDKKPTLSDLRDSGEIEENLDVVSFIYRDAYYTARDNGSENQSGLVDFYALKNRNGKLWGGQPLYYRDSGPSFVEVERRLT